jgi:hypothetical protein
MANQVFYANLHAEFQWIMRLKIKGSFVCLGVSLPLRRSSRISVGLFATFMVLPLAAAKS